MTAAFDQDTVCAARIRQFVPDIGEAELGQRVALMKARDHAAALRARTTSQLAADCAAFAHDLAGRFVFLTGDSAPRLEEAVQCCRNLVMAAMRADTLNSPETPL